MASLNEYDKKQLQLLQQLSEQIKSIYESAIVQISLTAAKISSPEGQFSLSLYPSLKKKIEQQLSGMQSSIVSSIVTANKGAWAISNDKNDVLVDKRLASKDPATKAKQILYDPNLKALQSFANRRQNGLNLSQRVWNTLQPFKSEMEQAIGLKIGEGVSAAKIATALKQYLNDPDKLFHQVATEDGKLKLSKAARNYSPGQGVYRSSYKNALRLSRTENNMAYRTADFLRWQNMPFVIGIRIQLSKAHPRYDICDRLVGIYPKDFYFPGWHPQCICFATPVKMSDPEYDKLQDAILAGEDIPPSSELITSPPAGFTQYVKENKKRIAGWKNTPYWVKENKEYYNQAASSRIKKTDSEKLKPAGQSIAEQFTKFASGIKQKATSALNLIDSVHGDGVLKNIPVKKVSNASYQAAFSSTYKGEPVDIRLSTKATDPELSMIHEMGHYLDLVAIGKSGVFSSTIAGSPAAEIVAAARETDAIKSMQLMKDTGVFLGDNGAIPISRGKMEHLRYLLSDEEIFARGYAQYIATVSNNATLMDGLSRRLGYEKNTGIQYQWSADDFKVIQDAFDNMMVKLGWRA